MLSNLKLRKFAIVFAYGQLWIKKRDFTRIRGLRVIIALILVFIFMFVHGQVWYTYVYINSYINSHVNLYSRNGTLPRLNTDSVQHKNCYNITILTPLRNRKHYVQTLAAGWSWLRIWQNARVHMFLDTSTEYSSKDLRSWFPYATVHSVNYKHPDLTTRAAFQFYVDNPPLASGSKCTDIAMVIDSDALLHLNWLQFIEHNFHTTDGVMSLYHSSVPWHKVIECNATLCTKQSIGAFGMMMSRTMAEQVLCHSHGGTKVYKRDFDWEAIYYLQSKNIRFFVPNRSMILHYGMHGTNNNAKMKNIEKAIGFEMVGYPAAIQEAAFHFLAGNKKLNPKMLKAITSIYMQQLQTNRSTYVD